MGSAKKFEWEIERIIDFNIIYIIKILDLVYRDNIDYD
jgi:hypothetical protein